MGITQLQSMAPVTAALYRRHGPSLEALAFLKWGGVWNYTDMLPRSQENYFSYEAVECLCP